MVTPDWVYDWPMSSSFQVGLLQHKLVDKLINNMRERERELELTEQSHVRLIKVGPLGISNSQSPDITPT
ncbi:hypothetical protein CMV_023092 [Castanea mollissima]|uniref:Uncharacterized protein n=1 Tax=Castanea mollissima TaxID=60419 RepID=A0A8J4VJ47_9ROSI|nr:hypothetical protein CMV_023092 [Castanea mollissima]